MNHDKLRHDFTNSLAIINSIADSTYKFLARFPENNTKTDAAHIQMFKTALSSIKQETDKIEQLFLKILDGNIEANINRK